MQPAPAPKQNPPYLLGLLCLIPLVGAMVGLGLLLYGIFRYHDKWLIMIGAFGIVFTVLIYSLLFAFMTRGDIASDGFKSIARMQLNQLVEEIEFYRLQNGDYPDSLPQLRKTDAFAPINDMLQESRKFKTVYYNYQKIGDKYTVFSSGKDGIPHTADDFYPQIEIPDSSKIGLIRVK
jgi:hypothetical protein